MEPGHHLKVADNMSSDRETTYDRPCTWLACFADARASKITVLCVSPLREQESKQVLVFPQEDEVHNYWYRGSEWTYRVCTTPTTVLGFLYLIKVGSGFPTAVVLLGHLPVDARGLCTKPAGATWVPLGPGSAGLICSACFRPWRSRTCGGEA